MNSINKSSEIVIKYIFFSIISSFINIASQFIFLLFYTSYLNIELSILFGTIMGMPPRYVLEKKYIFYFRANNLKHDGRIFVIYIFFSGITTLLFWAIEYLFHIVFMDDILRYIGGLIGLMIGFYIKYRLDKKYVFVKK